MTITAPNIILLTGFSDSLNEYVNRLDTPPSAARAVIIRALIDSMKNHGGWYILDDLHLYAAENEDQGHTNLVNPDYPKSVVVDAPTFTANNGFQMDGVNDAINSRFIFPIYRKNLQLNSACSFLWTRTAGTSNIADSGGITGGNTVLLTCRTGSNTITGRICDGTSDASTATHTDAATLIMINRPTDSIKQYFRSGVQLGADIARASTSVPASVSLSYYYGANQAGTFGTRQIAAGGLGGGHTPTQALNLYNSLATYMTAVGA